MIPYRFIFVRQYNTVVLTKRCQTPELIIIYLFIILGRATKIAAAFNQLNQLLVDCPQLACGGYVIPPRRLRTPVNAGRKWAISLNIGRAILNSRLGHTNASNMLAQCPNLVRLFILNFLLENIFIFITKVYIDVTEILYNGCLRTATAEEAHPTNDGARISARKYLERHL